MLFRGQLDHALKKVTCFGDLKINQISTVCRTKSDCTSDSEKKFQLLQTRGKTLSHRELVPPNEKKIYQNHFSLVFTSESFMVKPQIRILIQGLCSISKIIIFRFKYLLGCEGAHTPRRAMFQAKFRTPDKPPAIFY